MGAPLDRHRHVRGGDTQETTICHRLQIQRIRQVRRSQVRSIDPPGTGQNDDLRARKGRREGQLLRVVCFLRCQSQRRRETGGERAHPRETGTKRRRPDSEPFGV